MKLLLVCLLHPRSHIQRMFEIATIVQGLGWKTLETYGIILPDERGRKIGHYVDCSWYAEKPSLEAASAELEQTTLQLNDYQLHPFEKAAEIRERRIEDGYFDDHDIHG